MYRLAGGVLRFLTNRMTARLGRSPNIFTDARSRARGASALFFVALLLLVHTERRLAEAQYNFEATSESRLENDSALDGDEKIGRASCRERV